MPFPILRGFAILALLTTAVGCGETPYKVQGKVTFGGKPLPGGGSITFSPSGTGGRSAGGEIKEDGTYELTTIKPGDGTLAGEYRVIIDQVTEREPKNVGDNGKAVDRKGLSLPEADRIPTKYSDHYESPLTAKVEARNPNEINFDLKRN